MQHTHATAPIPICHPIVIDNMFVIKRDGRRETVAFDKITARIKKLSYGLNPDFCDPVCHSSKEIDCTPSPSLPPPPAQHTSR